MKIKTTLLSAALIAVMSIPISVSVNASPDNGSDRGGMADRGGDPGRSERGGAGPEMRRSTGTESAIQYLRARYNNVSFPCDTNVDVGVPVNQIQATSPKDKSAFGVQITRDRR